MKDSFFLKLFLFLALSSSNYSIFKYSSGFSFADEVTVQEDVDCLQVVDQDRPEHSFDLDVKPESKKKQNVAKRNIKDHNYIDPENNDAPIANNKAYPYFVTIGMGGIFTHKANNESVDMLLVALTKPMQQSSASLAIDAGNIFMHPQLSYGRSFIPRVSAGIYYNDIIGIEFAADYHASQSIKRTCDDGRQFKLDGSSVYASLFLRGKHLRYGAGIGYARLKISDDTPQSIYFNKNSYNACSDWDGRKALDELNNEIQSNMKNIFSYFKYFFPSPTQFFLDTAYFKDDSSGGTSSSTDNSGIYQSSSVGLSPIMRFFIGADWSLSDNVALSVDYNVRKTISRVRFEPAYQYVPINDNAFINTGYSNYVSPVMLYPYLTQDITVAFRWLFD